VWLISAILREINQLRRWSGPDYRIEDLRADKRSALACHKADRPLLHSDVVGGVLHGPIETCCEESDVVRAGC
jgi:hypothetical protein